VRAQAVWRLLGAPAALHMQFREGRHHGFIDVGSYRPGRPPRRLRPLSVSPSKSVLYGTFVWVRMQGA
jgi:hypothetical protein